MKALSKLPRHFIKKHQDEPEIAALDCMPLRSEKRRLHLRKLLNDGNYQHNVSVLANNTGQIIQHKRPSCCTDYDLFIPCEYCRAMFVKDCLWKHKKNCPFKPNLQRDENGRHCQGRGGLLLPISNKASEGLKRDVLSVMHQDEVTAAFRTDDLIMKFGSGLYFQHGHHPHRWQNIRERIRQLGRLLVQMRKSGSVKCLADCLVPEYFERVVTSVRDISGFDENDHVYATPTLVLKIGHSLKECAKLEMDHCTIQGTSSACEKKKKHEQFFALCEHGWSREVSKHALRSLHQRKFNKPIVLPLTEDVRLLHDYLQARSDECMHNLYQEPTILVWSELCQITLTQIVTFNRRRGGEAQRMLLSTYRAENTENVSDDIRTCLSQLELALCREFRIVNIEGKRGRKVPVLLTVATQAQIGTLIELRSAVGVLPTNKFVFARRNSLEPLRSSDCLRRFSKECGARTPGSLTSTKLRKHIATMSQMLSLRKHELDLLATFLGHDIRVHREFYRLPEQTLQVAKVSKLLIAMERGETVTLQGRNLDDIDVDVPGQSLMLCEFANNLHAWSDSYSDFIIGLIFLSSCTREHQSLVNFW